MATTLNYNNIIDRSESLREYLNSMARTNTKNLSERDARIISNHSYAMHIAAQYQYMGVSIEDLFATAMLGLIEASDHYDPSKGSDFTPYACRWMRKAICQLINDCGHSVRIPNHVARALKHVNKVQQAFFVSHGREASFAELSAITKMDEAFLNTIMQSTARFQSLDKSLGEDSDAYLSDMVPSEFEAPDAELHREDVRAKVDAILDHLRPNQREVLVRYFFNEESFSTIALHMGITTTRVRQIFHQVCPAGLP